MHALPSLHERAVRLVRVRADAGRRVAGAGVVALVERGAHDRVAAGAGAGLAGVDLVQALPSLQLVPFATAVWMTPFVGWQLSVVQGLPSSTVGGVPDWQMPAALQVSAPLHTVLSAQEVPAATGVWVTPLVGWQASVVHGFWSSTVGGVPGTQLLDTQVSTPLQALPSLQPLPQPPPPLPVSGVCHVLGDFGFGRARDCRCERRRCDRRTIRPRCCCRRCAVGRN